MGRRQMEMLKSEIGTEFQRIRILKLVHTYDSHQRRLTLNFVVFFAMKFHIYGFLESLNSISRAMVVFDPSDATIKEVQLKLQSIFRSA